MNWQIVLVVALLSIGCLVDATKSAKGGGKKPDNRERKKLQKARETCVGGVCTKNMGKSGRFEIRMRNKNDSDKMTLLFDSIYERDNSSKMVGKSGKLKHSLESFAPLEFLYTPVEKMQYKGSINATSFTFEAPIPGANANLSVNMYFFEGNGTGEVCENETFPIYPGMVKFDITIEGWSFCTPATCKNNETGEMVDFKMTFQKKGKAKRGKKRKNQPKGKKAITKFFIGDQDLGFPSSYELDGNKCGEMPEGYPKFNANAGGGKFSVVFRFPKFANKVFYDPTVGDGRDKTDYTDVTDVDESATTAPPAGGTTPAPDSAASHALPSLFATAFLGVIARIFL